MRRLALLAVLALTSACILERRTSEGLAFLEVRLVSPGPDERGTPEAPLPMPRGNREVILSITAIDRDGEVMDCLEGRRCFQGGVALDVTPGMLPKPNPYNERSRPFLPHARGEYIVPVVNGRAENVRVTIRGAFGMTNLWAEEWPVTREDGLPTDSRYVAGVSEPIWFTEPSLQDLQFDPDVMSLDCTDRRACDNTASPLIGNFVGTRPSRYLVTGITNDGFFATDLGNATAPAIEPYPGRFNAIFLYNFSYPQDLMVGDVVTRLYGTVQEFTGHTQLVFPQWEKEPWSVTREEPLERACTEDADCPVNFTCPDASSGPRRCRLTARPIDGDLCAIGMVSENAYQSANLCGESASNIHLESLESGWVELPLAYMPTRFRNCDLDGDGDVPNRVPDGEGGVFCNAECQCKVECSEEDGCSELSALLTYGQYAVTIDGPRKMKINVVTRDSTPEVVPFAVDPEDPDGRRLLHGNVKIRVRGNLRQTLPARPRWMILSTEPGEFCCREEDPGRCGAIPPCEDDR